MERIVYRKTLDVHKNGIQFMLRGFETADKLSRVIEVSLMASGDAIDFPLSEMVAMMYVTTPSATEPSINECIIKDNKVVYEALPITEEGITTMQLKLIETSVEGATSVLVSPSFAVEVIKSNVDDSGAEQKTTFTALEDAVAKAKSVYDARFLRMELTNDCIFKAYYADGTEYETDILKKLFYNGNVLLSESYAHGNTGTRIGEDTDNSMYYSKVSESEALNAKRIMENSEDILEEVKLHGVYTAFNVNFETGEAEYVSPHHTFKINTESGELDAEQQSDSFDAEIRRLVDEWLMHNGVYIDNLIATVGDHTTRIFTLVTNVEDDADKIVALLDTTANHGNKISTLEEGLEEEKTKVVPIELGGTGATTVETALANMGIFYPTNFTLYTHIGKGGYGADNPCSATLPFVPKIVIPCSGTTLFAPWVYGKNNAMTLGTPSGGGEVSLTWDGINLSWYSDSEMRQMNVKDKEYTLIVLG